MMRFMRNKEHKVRRGSVLDTRGGLWAAAMSFRCYYGFLILG